MYHVGNHVSQTIEERYQSVFGMSEEEFNELPAEEQDALIDKNIIYDRVVPWENETVEFTNKFMKRFYNEVPRDDYFDLDNYGINPRSPLWDNNSSNFSRIPRWLGSSFSSATGNENRDLHTGLSQDPNNVLKAFENVDPQKIANLGPEVAALYEVRTSPKHFNETMQMMKGNTNLTVGLMKLQAAALTHIAPMEMASTQKMMVNNSSLMTMQI